MANIEFALTHLKERRENQPNADIGNFSIVGDGEVLQEWNNAPCYAGLELTKLHVYRQSEYLVSIETARGYSARNLAHLDYVDYIINRSPWALAHVIKDPETVLKQGFIVTTNVPGPFMVTAALALRATTEYPNQPSGFLRLKEMMTEDRAFIASCFMQFSNRNWRMVYVDGHHVSMPQYGKKALRNWLSHNPPKAPTWREDCHYRQYARYWAGGEADEMSQMTPMLMNAKAPGGVNTFGVPLKDVYGRWQRVKDDGYRSVDPVATIDNYLKQIEEK